MDNELAHSGHEKQSVYSDGMPASTTTSAIADEKALHKNELGNGDVREPTIPEENEFTQDAFQGGDGTADHVDFRTMGWVQAGFVCLAEAIALGALSFPSIYQRLGVAGGVLATFFLTCLAYITAWMYIDFKVQYMGVMNVADAGTIMFGRIGGIIFGVGIMVKVSALKRVLRDQPFGLTFFFATLLVYRLGSITRLGRGNRPQRNLQQCHLQDRFHSSHLCRLRLGES